MIDRQKPDAARPAPVVVEVLDLEQHRLAVAEFCLALCEATVRQGRFGAVVRRDPDSGLVEVHGVVGERTWQIGRLAAETHELLDHALPLSASIQTIRIGSRGPYEIKLRFPCGS